MKGKRLLAGIMTAIMCFSMTGIITVSADTEKSKTLVAYYSASGTTEKIANYIAEEMNADVFVITPVNEYTSADLNWTDTNSRVVQEHNDPDNRYVELVQTIPDNFESYNNVFIGYPIWWGEASWVVDDFVKENDFSGKNVIPFCTAISSPLGESGNLLKKMAGTGNWLEGMRFTSSSTKSNIVQWIDSLNIKSDKTYILGDANDDGKFDIRDAAFIARKVAQRKYKDLPEKADYNNDNKIDIRDAAAIARAIARRKGN